MAVHDELTAANASYAEDFSLGAFPARPVRRFAVVTCMDARLDPVAFLGLRPGDAHVLRNAGGVVSDDVLRSLAVSHGVLGTKEAFVIAHTNCGMQRFTDEEIRAQLAQEPGVDPTGVEFLSFTDLEQSVRASVRRIRESQLLPDSFGTTGLVYDTATGLISPVE
jgi:carbonic anhydrase